MTVGWAPFAVIEPGPEWKHSYPGVSELPTDLREGFVYHSMVGSLSASHDELHKPTRRASWTFSNPKIGPLIQHYPVYYKTWANGSPLANTKFGSCENEGGPPGNESEPLTRNQIDNLVELTVWLYNTQEWTDVSRLRELWEHRELGRFGSPATACPSDRIPWQTIIAEAEKIIEESGDDDMPTEKQLENRAKADAIFSEAAAHIRQGRIPPKELRGQLQWFLTAWKAQD